LCGKYGASAEIGWEWEQEFYNLDQESKYYNLRLDLFSSQGLDLQGLLFTERLYSNITDVTLPPFKILFTI